MRTTLAAAVFLLNAGFAQTVNPPADDHDFGVVRQGDRVSHRFLLRNMGDAPLRLDKVELDVAGVSARFPQQVAPGAEANVTLEWNTARETGDAEGSATVFANGAPRQVLHFRAHVQPPIEFEPFAAVFFSAYTDQTPEKSVRIINHEKEPLVIRRIEAPEHFDVKAEEVQPGREYRLSVRVRKGGAPGRTTEPIYLHTTSSEHPRLQVNANLFLKRNFYAFPEEISFGAVRISGLQGRPEVLEFLSQSTVIENREGPVELRSVTSDVPFLRITGEPGTGASEKFLLKIDLDPAKATPGKFQGSIRVVTTDPKRPELVVPVTGVLL